ncbi:MAG: sensor histidine kinase [Actinomycetes bacterium]
MTASSADVGVGWLPGASPRRWRWSVAGVAWLVFLVPVVSDALSSTRSGLARGLTLLDLAAFAALYLFAVPLVAARPARDPIRYAMPVLGLALGLLTLPVTGEEGLGTLVYVCVLAVGLLPLRIAIAFAGATGALAVAIDVAVTSWRHDLTALLFSMLLATSATAAFVRLLRRNLELAAAREGLAELAVEQERARFARDLHDLLGHSLTVITVKSELAGRLMTRDPSRAATEVADIERLAREALADVRATVAGYREVTLAAEVSAARAALDAAGIHAELPGALDEVPGERRELFGWVVREGITNVVRHSRADRVRVSVSRTTVEVVDDGTGCATRAAPGRVGEGHGPEGHGPEGQVVAGQVVEGHGLAGLRERLAAVGGRLEAAPLVGGGFRLYAEVPA